MGQGDWQHLLDDPVVLTIIKRVATYEGRAVYPHPDQALYRDDLESYLTDKAVDVARKYDPHSTWQWYPWLTYGLRQYARSHRSGPNGPGKHSTTGRRALQGGSLEGIVHQTGIPLEQITAAAESEYRDPARAILFRERVQAVIDHLEQLDDVDRYVLTQGQQRYGGRAHSYEREVRRVKVALDVLPIPTGPHCPTCYQPTQKANGKQPGIAERRGKRGECAPCYRLRRRRQ